MTKHITMTRDDLESLIGDNAHRLARRMPEEDATLEDIEASGLFAEINSREAYLDWVARYKAWTHASTDAIRGFKAERRNPDPSLRYRAQVDAYYAALCVTLAIRMRRLGKRWSAQQAERRRLDSAA